MTEFFEKAEKLRKTPLVVCLSNGKELLFEPTAGVHYTAHCKGNGTLMVWLESSNADDLCLAQYAPALVVVFGPGQWESAGKKGSFG